MRAVVCDTQAPFTRGVATYLRSEGFAVEEAHGLKGLAVTVAKRVDLLVIDAELFARASALGILVPPSAKVVVVGHAADPVSVLRALDGGASAYLMKSVTAARLLRACRAVLNGAEVVDQAAAAALAPRPRRVLLSDGSHVMLSPREYEVANRVRDGLPTREIANALGISVVTVRRHISATMDKVGVRNRESLRSRLNPA